MLYERVECQLYYLSVMRSVFVWLHNGREAKRLEILKLVFFIDAAFEINSAGG